VEPIWVGGKSDGLATGSRGTTLVFRGDKRISCVEGDIVLTFVARGHILVRPRPKYGCHTL